MKKIAFIAGLVFFYSLTKMKAQNTLTFTESYIGGVNPTSAQKTHWTNFIASLASNYCYTKVRFYGSNNTTGFTVTNPSDVATIASNIRQGISFQLASGGNNWQYCSNDLRINGPAVNYCGICDFGNCLRPMSGYGGNWGGLNGNTCGAGSQTITLEFTYSTPNVNLGSDTTICGNSIVLDAGNSGATYSWQDNSIAQTYTATIDGTYYVSVTNSCGSSSDTIQVTFAQTPNQPSIVMGDSTVCQNSLQTFSVSNAADATSYIWSLPAGWMGSSNTTSINVTPGNASGTLSVTAVNSCGNSPIRTITVNETIVDTSVILNGNNLISNATSATYNWYNCSLMQVVSGATGQSFSPPQNGIYAVIVTQDGCIDTSSCYNITTTGIAYIGNSEGFTIYPNPANSFIQITTNNSQANKVKIYDVLGKQVLENENLKLKNGKEQLDISNLSNGVYYIKVGNSTQKFIKQ